MSYHIQGSTVQHKSFMGESIMGDWPKLCDDPVVLQKVFAWMKNVSVPPSSVPECEGHTRCTHPREYRYSTYGWGLLPKALRAFLV